MATVFVGKQVGAFGFQRLVALKRPHQHLVEDPRFAKTLLAEARLASRILHVNVVGIRDVVAEGGAIYLVMDYIEGASLREFIVEASKQGVRPPAAAAIRIVLDACAGLHAAHCLTDERGEPLGVVHRDISPQNILVGSDGVSRVVDFGIAKCANSGEDSTTTGTLKGKFSYMAPEYIRGGKVDRRADVFSMAVVAWEALSGLRLFQAETHAESVFRVLNDKVPLLGELQPELATLDPVLARGLDRDPETRYATVEAFASELEAAARGVGGAGSPSDVARLVGILFGERLSARAAQLADRMAEATGDGDAGRATEPLPAGVSISQRVTEPASGALAGGAFTESLHTPSASVPIDQAIDIPLDEPSGREAALPGDTASLEVRPPPSRGWVVPAVAGATVALVSLGVWQFLRDDPRELAAPALSVSSSAQRNATSVPVATTESDAQLDGATGVGDTDSSVRADAEAPVVRDPGQRTPPRTRERNKEPVEPKVPVEPGTTATGGFPSQPPPNPYVDAGR